MRKAAYGVTAEELRNDIAILALTVRRYDDLNVLA